MNDPLFRDQVFKYMNTLEQQVRCIERRMIDLERRLSLQDPYYRTHMESTSHGSADTPQNEGGSMGSPGRE